VCWHETEIPVSQFADIVHFNSLLVTDSSDWSVWPAVTIAKPTEVNTDGQQFAYIAKGVPADGWTCSSDDGCKAFLDGGSGANWNYGSNFGGPTKSTWTSGADTAHDVLGGGGWGFAVMDSGYGSFMAGANAQDGTYDNGSQMNVKISVCPGTAGATCRG
jgi:hypothetical protein